MNQKERIIELVRQGVITTEEALTLLEAKNQSHSSKQATQNISEKTTENTSIPTDEKNEETAHANVEEDTIETPTGESQAEQETIEDNDLAKQIRQIADGALEFGKGTYDSITKYIKELNQAETSDNQADKEDKDFYDETFDFSEEYRQDQADLEEELSKHQQASHSVDDETKRKAERQATEEQLAQLTEKINQLSAQIDQVEATINKKQEALTVAKQRYREIEIFSELDEITEEMLAQKAHLSVRVEELEKEIVDLEHTLDETKKELEAMQSKQSAYKHQDFKRMVDQATDQANKIGTDAIKEGKKISESITSKVRDLMQNFNTKEFNVSVNVPWVKTETIKHQFMYDAAEITVIDFVLNNGSLKFKTHDQATILVDSEIRFHGKHDAYTVETFEQLNTISFDNNQLIFHVNSPRVSMDATVYLPKRIYDYVKIDLLNGDATLKEIEINDLLINNKNGDIRLKEVKAVLAELDSVNGDITIKNSEIKDITVKNINGDFRISGMVGNIISNTVNGDYYITKTDTNNSTFKLKSVSGDIKISLPLSMNLEIKNEITFGEIKNRLSNVETVSESKDHKKGEFSRLTHTEAGRVTVDTQVTTGDIYLKDSDIK
ncbi:DUF4097 family beta strand repeat-containing protein [Fundicoccus culcitae]|uniref:DUF4097 family beta strand repeat-containing protein n=1 Tax=Fundicoccus culcitae TaxID=2969821 RepID=A0ABY5P2U8_9LACT|nr:DUF4097 family beta strand repeat-containing protein [Fundicoccus culcitae]UUX32926.1 DUF4097 family beta strand repeat-containing protein [Fundicoccus culcitae]